MTNIQPEISKFKAELAFVRLHWTALSGVVVAAAVVGLLIGFYLGHKV